jgi:FkbM family methyltransferase
MNSSLLYNYFAHFKACGFEPEGILDVGANMGTWTGEMMSMFPTSEYFMIEGNKLLLPYLEQTHIPYEISLVGNYTGKAKFYIQRGVPMSTGNSMFKENSIFYEDAIEVEVPISTLDEIIERRQVGPFQVLKLDIQGAEIDALLGASKTLESVEVIQTECSFMQYNEGSPPFFETHLLLHGLGFSLFGVSDFLSDPYQFPVQMDAIWVKRTSSLWRKECTRYPPPEVFSESKKFTKSPECDTRGDNMVLSRDENCETCQCYCSKTGKQSNDENHQEL